MFIFSQNGFQCYVSIRLFYFYEVTMKMPSNLSCLIGTLFQVLKYGVKYSMVYSLFFKSNF